MSDTNVKEILNALGDDAVSQNLGVGKDSLRAAKYRGKFPASWRTIITTMCAGKGIDCPESLFNMRERAS